jgi:hypothetical protein
MKKWIPIFVMTTLLMSACAAPRSGGPDASHGARTALTGTALLVLAPFQIAAGLIEGIASIPFFIATDIHKINQGLNQAQAEVNLDDTYEWAYGKRLNQVPSTGETGEVFRRMKHATSYFQEILRKYGVADYDRYILTSIDTANSQGYTLFAVVYRPHSSIEVWDKYEPTVRRHLTRDDRLYYEPFEADVNGRPLDIVSTGGASRGR